MALLDKLGYRNEMGGYNVTKDSNLFADSLIGIKYVISKKQIRGLKETNIFSYDGKKVFENPYYLPIAFTYNSNNSINLNGNPFEFSNALFSKLYGEKVLLLKKEKYYIHEKKNKNSNEISYIIKSPGHAKALYGNILWKKQLNAKLNVNSEYTIPYAQFASQSVFYIPSNSSKSKVVLKTKKRIHNEQRKPQFYSLDLNLLKKICSAINNRKAEKINIKNGKVLIHTHSLKDNELFISIPYDQGWSISVNGNENAKVNKVADCFYSIPIKKGNNNVVMKYTIPGIKTGVIIFALGIISMVVTILLENKYLKERKKEI